jgi:hypothetical protein
MAKLPAGVKTPRELVLAASKGHATASADDTPWSTLISDFVLLLPEAVTVAAAALSGDDQAAKSALLTLSQNTSWQALTGVAASAGFGTIGVLGGGEGSVIVGGKGVAGILTGTTDTSNCYSYWAAGLSVGAQEGAVAVTGLYLHSDQPSEDWCIEYFEELAGDFGAGVAAEMFTTWSTGWGASIFASTGEELEASFGAAYASWSLI